MAPPAQGRSLIQLDRERERERESLKDRPGSGCAGVERGCGASQEGRQHLSESGDAFADQPPVDLLLLLPHPCGTATMSWGRAAAYLSVAYTHCTPRIDPGTHTSMGGGERFGTQLLRCAVLRVAFYEIGLYWKECHRWAPRRRGSERERSSVLLKGGAGGPQGGGGANPNSRGQAMSVD